MTRAGHQVRHAFVACREEHSPIGIFEGVGESPKLLAEIAPVQIRNTSKSNFFSALAMSVASFTAFVKVPACEQAALPITDATGLAASAGSVSATPLLQDCASRQFRQFRQFRAIPEPWRS